MPVMFLISPARACSVQQVQKSRTCTLTEHESEKCDVYMLANASLQVVLCTEISMCKFQARRVVSAVVLDGSFANSSFMKCKHDNPINHRYDFEVTPRQISK